MKRKLQVKDSETSDDSEGSTSSDENEIFSEEMNKDFLKTLEAIKKNDPSIYNPDNKFYKEHYDLKTQEKTKAKSENLYEAEIKYIKNPLLNEKKLEDVGVEERREQELKNSFAEALKDGLDDDDFLNCEDDDDEEDTKKQKNIQAPKPQKESLNTEEEKEKFLKNYILNFNNLLDEDTEEKVKLAEIGDEEDEEEMEKEAAFEHKYNFRFEEPDDEFIKTYPRTIESSVRRGKKSRSDKRKEAKAKKIEMKKKQEESMDKVRSMQAKEYMKLMSKLDPSSDPDPSMFDLEGDFDPDAHDAVMKKYFGNDFYAENDNEEKPVFDDDEASSSKKEPAFVKASKKKLKNYNAQLQKMIDENNNDKLPFLYRKVYATDYGMSVQEILDCDDTELNSWLPLRKIITCKTDEEEVMLDRKMKRDQKKKKKICKSLYVSKDEDLTMKKKKIKLEKDEKSVEIPSVDVVKEDGNKDEDDDRNKDEDDDVNKKEDNDVSKGENETKLKKSKKVNKKKNLKNVENKISEGIEIPPSENVKDNESAGVSQFSITKDSKFVKGENNKKRKINKKKKKAVSMSEDRLKAYQIDAKKFKYHYLPKLNKKS